ncbi:MAG TPA: SAM-dependent methyltransferase [Candidatus Omnitrophota bacterium]|nr:SAM-dependent methyltransferase [Candidatus Omnitrophota bacterium]
MLREKYPLLKKNVMVYSDEERGHLLINPHSSFAKKLTPLADNETMILKQLNGQSKAKDICRFLRLGSKEVFKKLKKWSNKEWNMVMFLDAPIDKIRNEKIKGQRYAWILEDIYREFYSSQQANEDAGAMREYHQKKIKDAMQQFENIEMTVSHTYKDPHILLGGKNYGASFAEVLIHKGVIKEGVSILEVGAGTGIFGRSFLDEIKKTCPKAYRSIKYTFFDLSPVLLASQRRVSNAHRLRTEFILGNAQSHNFKNKTFDLIISNEMIADLRIVKLSKSNMGNSALVYGEKKRAIDLIKRFKLNVSDAPKEFLFNLGAAEFLLAIKRILRPGGEAYIIEYGNLWSYPKAVHLKGHTEYSIHFGHLKELARKINMSPRVTKLADFLPFNKKIKVVSYISWLHINEHLLPFLSYERLPYMAYTEGMMKEKIGKIFDRLDFIGFSYVGNKETLCDSGLFLVLSMKG